MGTTLSLTPQMVDTLAYDFDGSDDYIQSSGPDNWTQQSVSFWMQTTGSTEDFPRLVEKGA